MKASGAQLIAAERKRQIAQERWTKKHDREEHPHGALAIAAACYAVNKIDRPLLPFVALKTSSGIELDAFPFERRFDKREKHDRLRSLIIAGALIAAEIDRIRGV